MSKLLLRFCAQKGETLVETLISILVVAISSALLMGAISGAVRINLEVRASDEAYRAQLNIAEKGQGDIEDELIISMEDGAIYRYDVYYAGEEGKLRSYDRVKAVTSP